MYFAAYARVKLRLVVVMMGLVAMVTGRCGWAGGVQPSAEPRFGVEGERHRMVLPLSAFPSDHPSASGVGATVDVTLADLTTPVVETRVPHILSASAGAIQDVVIRDGGVSIHTRQRVEQARAFLLRAPPRLVVDVRVKATPLADGEAAVQEQPPARDQQSPVAVSEAPDTTTAADGGTGVGLGDASPQVSVEEARAVTVKTESARTSESADSACVDPAGPKTSGSSHAYRLGAVNDWPMIWPDLDARFYARAEEAAATEAFLTPRRNAILRGRAALAARGDEAARGPDEHGDAGDLSPGSLPKDAPAAAHFLDADMEYLRATAHEGDFLSAIALYRRAVRLAPSFPDRDRGSLMIGFAELAMGLGVEAEASLSSLARTARDPSVASLACLGAGRASRVARNNDRAAGFFRKAIVGGGRSDGACRARGDLGVILAESSRGKEALAQFEEMLMLCPADVVRAPRSLLERAGVLAAAGHAREAEKLLLALPEFEGQLFIRRKFIEGELAIALGTPEFARSAYEAIRAYEDAPSEAQAEATLRLVQLEDAAGRHDGAAALLSDVALKYRSVAVRAKALATAAELLVLRGGYPEALKLLERADALGPAGLATAEEVRSRLFQSWIVDLAKKGDDAGILAVFYGYRGDGVGSHLHPEGVVRVASAAAELGLPDLAVQVVLPVSNRVGGTARVEAQRILAQAALDKGDDANVLRLTEDITRSEEGGQRRSAVARIRSVALLRLDRVDEAVSLLRVFGTREDLVALVTKYLHVKRDPEKAYVILESALAGAEKAGERSPALLAGWLAMAEAAGQAGKHELAAAALRTAIRLFPDEAAAGMQYRLAHAESMGASPAQAAERYATAAQMEGDPLLARAARAEAAYFRALQEKE